MSVESTFHPAKATRNNLKSFLESRGYVACEHLWKWPTGSLHFHWFNPKDNLSFDGVEATIFRPADDPHKLGACDWALHTRTRASGSRADKVEQNETIRRAKALFGGNFYNDWGGRNRYSQEPPELRDASSRGLYLAYEVVDQHLRAVTFSLPPENEHFSKLETAGLADLARTDPARVLFNALLPFAVSSLEGFFSRAFVILIQYNEAAQIYLAGQTRKMDFEDALAISRGERTIEDVGSSWYSFQNVGSIQKAFSEWLKLDFRKILRETPRSTGMQPLDQALIELIKQRHEIIHKLNLNFSLRRDGVAAAMETVQAVIEAFVDHLEKTHCMVIRDETAWRLREEN